MRGTSRFARLAAGAAGLLALGAAAARAQHPGAGRGAWLDPAAEVAPLRRRLESLEAAGAPAGTVRSLRHLLSRIAAQRPRRRGAGTPWLDRARRYLRLAERGRDPYHAARGEITLRAYRSPVSERLQGYAVYVPPDYDPARAYPLLVALHGGSSNGNLFLALTLGATVPWRDYRDHWDRVHAPRRTPQWIVVAPDGFGNSMWRFMGERDVLDVIADASRHYRIDPARVVLYGMSNGGLGSFDVGTRHAWRFSAVVPLAGAPGWIHYLGGRPSPRDRRALAPQSAWALLENARNTHLHAHHGRRDPGPMDPRYVRALRRRADVLDVPFALTWYARGHDLVEPVQRRGQIFEREARRRRDPRPAEVTLVTGDYRASRQHWVTVTRIEGYPSLARVEARARGGAVEVRTERARALTLNLGAAPLADGPVELRIDGDRLPLGRARGLVHLIRRGGRWARGRPRAAGLEKRPGLSGPIPDAYWERLIHVYGTADPAHTATLREAAERGARGWIGNLRGVRQRVIADTALTAADLARGHLVLYGSPADNAVLARLADRLPIRIAPGAVTVGGRRHVGRHLGVRFIHPNPLRPDRYVIVQAAADPRDVLAGDRLPAFLPDWVVYDARRLPERRTNLWTGHGRPVASGFFDDRWQLPAAAPPRVALAPRTR